MIWQLSINFGKSSPELVEWLSEFLTDHQALAITLQDGGNQPLFQEKLNHTPLWKKIQIQALFADREQAQPVVEKLQILLGSLDYELIPVPDQDWVKITQRQFSPQCFADRLWIVPAWHDRRDFPGIVLWLEPGLGFGTGSHPTTALCLEWIARQSFNNKIVIDYGCGSGILGLSALALGAKEVWAVDHDPQALMATLNNAQVNKLTDTQLHAVLPEQLPDIKADVILANILANPLCELAPKIISHLKSDAYLMLSGFLITETDRVSKAYQSMLHVVDQGIRDNWVRLVLKNN